MYRTGIIGAGIAGLATAIRLQQAGNQVEVFETNNFPGGKLSQLESNGYRWDAGPSLFTLPHLVDELFLLCGKNPADYFHYERLDPVCRYFYEDGTVINAFAEPEAFAREIEQKLQVPAEIILRYLEEKNRLFKSSGKLFLEKSLHRKSTYLNQGVFHAMKEFRISDFIDSMHGQNLKRFKHPKLVQLFNRFATYNGSNPYQAPGLLNMISSLEHIHGAFLPKGGMISITNSLYRLALENGVKFHFNESAKTILTRGKTVVGLETVKSRYSFDRVVSNMDVYPTYLKLLPSFQPPKVHLQQERSSSAMIFYWGIRPGIEDLGVHNIFFSENYQEEFEYIFKKREPNSDPTVYINITSGLEPEDAPKGGQNWFVMVNVPADYGQDWDHFTAEIKKSVLTKLSRLLKQNVGYLIEAELQMDPRGIENRTGSFRGALYGTSSNKCMAAFLRHPNFNRHLQGLYFCGGSVHPGGGIPLCLNSARIVAENFI